MVMIKQKRNYIITIVALVIINVACLFLLWLGKPKHDMRGTEIDVNEKVRIKEMLREELGFSEEQTKQYLTLRESHRAKSDIIEEEIKNIKKEMFNEAMLTDHSAISDSLLDLALLKQRTLEKTTFEHFHKLKNICTPEQQNKLINILHTLLGPPKITGRPPHGGMPDGLPRGEMPNGPPPGEFKEGHPPPRN